MKLLVIDDDPVLARAIGRMFAGHDVTVEIDAMAALERLRSGEWFDLILCDERMPGMKGSEILDDVRARYGVDCPMLVSISGHADVSVPTADVQLAKPFQRPEVGKLVETWYEMKIQRSAAETERISKT